MPKLSSAAAGKNRELLERAALGCFVRFGFHGVSVRQIADAAGVSLGNLYTYFPDKQTIYSSLLARLSEDFLRSDNAFARYLGDCRFPDDLDVMGAAIGANVERYRDYFKMIYLDVVEFDGKHIREIFSRLDEKFDLVIGKRFRALGRLGPKRNVDPAVAFIAVYMAFYQYFLLTKVFGAKATYGARSDGEVVAALSELFLGGIKPKRRRRR